MKYRIFEFAGQGYVESGSYGMYYNLNDGTGIKITHSEINIHTASHTRVELEFENQKLAYELLGDKTPKPIEIVIAKLNDGTYHEAIIMEHIDGKRICDIAPYDYEQHREMLKALDELMASVGIYKFDSGSHNTLLTVNGEYIVIDWGGSGNRFEKKVG